MRTVPTVRVGRTVHHDGRRRAEVDGCVLLVLKVALAVALPCFAAYHERAARNLAEGLGEAVERVVPLGSARTGDLAHAVASDLDVSASDPDFGVELRGALQLARHTEYCQWAETSKTRCEQCHDALRNETVDCNCETTYYYTKTWRSHRILSLGFDQPAAHHNPQRDPFPSATFVADRAVGSTEGGRVALGRELLERARAPRRRVDWTLGAVPEPSWWRRWWPSPGATRYEEVAKLRGVESSRAAGSERFAYVGQGGYFFSPYQSSMAGSLFNYFIQYVEGSLLDWQLGDLLPSCTAGDIRAYFSVRDPAVVSAAGKVLQPLGGKAAAGLGVFATPKGHLVGMVHAGQVSFDAMVKAELWDQQLYCFLGRALLGLWAWGMTSWLGFDGDRRGALALGTAGLWAVSLGLTWALLWGLSLEVAWPAVSTPSLLALGGVAVVQALRIRRGLRPASCPEPTKAKGL